MRQRKIGIILIIGGIIIPLLTFPFLSGYSKEKGFLDNFYDISIQIKRNKTEYPPESFNFSKLIPGKIPLRYFLVITVVLIYMGIIRIDSSRKKKDQEE